MALLLLLLLLLLLVLLLLLLLVLVVLLLERRRSTSSSLRSRSAFKFKFQKTTERRWNIVTRGLRKAAQLRSKPQPNLLLARQQSAQNMASSSSKAALRLVTTPQLVEVIAQRVVVPFAGYCCGLYLFLRRRRLLRQLVLEPKVGPSAATTATTTTTTQQPKGPTTDFSTNLSLRLRPLENRDFSNYFLQLLGELTTVGELPRSWCEQRLRMLDPSPSPRSWP